MFGGTRKQSSPSAHDDEGRAKTFPRSGRARVPPQLLMGLLANHRALSVAAKLLEVHSGGQVGEIVISSLPTRGARRSAKPRPLEDAAAPCPISAGEDRRQYATRTAANRALSRPFVPLRQLTVSPLRTGQPCTSAPVDRLSGTCRLRGPASNFGNWPNELYPNRVHLEVTRDANRPGKLAGRQPLTERPH